MLLRPRFAVTVRVPPRETLTEILDGVHVVVLVLFTRFVLQIRAKFAGTCTRTVSRFRLSFAVAVARGTAGTAGMI